ncbi:hypothetical protein C8J56DRAFT_917842 [Mycena floridula]|nr:hypothetical protein C8J56DRAFT_917842 [Mycena floridula]
MTAMMSGASQSRPVERVTKNLLSIGALTLADFLQRPFENQPSSTSGSYQLPIPVLDHSPEHNVSGENELKNSSGTNHHSISRLHQASQRVFGSSLKFEFIEENGPSRKQCILTITRPNGMTRSYKTDPCFSKKMEAKAHVANVALKMGAMEFLLSGQVKTARSSLDDLPDEVKIIHDLCIQWRGERVKPQWYPIRDPRFGNKYGAALKIQLSPHSFRVYSSIPEFETLDEAKISCAKSALNDGIREFIEDPSGQSQSQSQDSSQSSSQSKPPGPITLQSFYESLPRPFPEDFGDKTVNEINPLGYLNSAIQAARGSKFVATWLGFANQAGLHGCLLRLDRPSQSKSYLVEPQFSKRTDAKNAVCFQAMSEGLCVDVRALAEENEKKVTDAMRKLASSRIIPTLSGEYSKARSGQPPLDYRYTQEQDAFGCSLTIQLNAKHVRHYSVPAEFRTKTDAKVALACVAAEQGAVEFLRFQGRPVPATYRPYLAIDAAQVLADQRLSNNKRKAEADGSSNADSEALFSNKRLKLDVSVSDGRSSPEPHSPAFRLPVSLPNRPPVNSWEKVSENRKRKHSDVGGPDQRKHRSWARDDVYSNSFNERLGDETLGHFGPDEWNPYDYGPDMGYPGKSGSSSLYRHSPSPWVEPAPVPSMYPPRNSEKPSMYPPRNKEAISMYPPRNTEAPYPSRDSEKPSMYPPRNTEAPYPARNTEKPSMYPPRNAEGPSMYPPRDKPYPGAHSEYSSDPYSGQSYSPMTGSRRPNSASSSYSHYDDLPPPPYRDPSSASYGPPSSSYGPPSSSYRDPSSSYRNRDQGIPIPIPFDNPNGIPIPVSVALGHDYAGQGPNHHPHNNHQNQNQHQGQHQGQKQWQNRTRKRGNKNKHQNNHQQSHSLQSHQHQDQQQKQPSLVPLAKSNVSELLGIHLFCLLHTTFFTLFFNQTFAPNRSSPNRSFSMN